MASTNAAQFHLGHTHTLARGRRGVTRPSARGKLCSLPPGERKWGRGEGGQNQKPAALQPYDPRKKKQKNRHTKLPEKNMHGRARAHTSKWTKPPMGKRGKGGADELRGTSRQRCSSTADTEDFRAANTWKGTCRRCMRTCVRARAAFRGDRQLNSPATAPGGGAESGRPLSSSEKVRVPKPEATVTRCGQATKRANGTAQEVSKKK
jgi:hypothetical protein